MKPPLSSLRARLLVFVLLAILATALLQAALAWRAARAEADALFDYQMRQTAQTLRAGLPEGLATGVLPVPPEQQDFDFVLQIWTLDGVQIFGSAQRAELPQRAVLGFSNVKANGTLANQGGRLFTDHDSVETPTAIDKKAKAAKARKATLGETPQAIRCPARTSSARLGIKSCRGT